MIAKRYFKFNKLNKKGFTLIELLAVIVILGILMITSVPAVTKYINSSKKSTFADSAGSYINAARYSLLNDEYSTCATPAEDNQFVIIPLYKGNTDNIDIDKGTGKSSYNKDYNKDSYVKVEYSGGKLNYSICLVDGGNNGTGNSDSCLVEEKSLGKNVVSAGTAKFVAHGITDDSKICYK